MEGGAETGALVAAELLDDLAVAYPEELAALVETVTEAPRASYHAGFGQRMKRPAGRPPAADPSTVLTGVAERDIDGDRRSAPATIGADELP